MKQLNSQFVLTHRLSNNRIQVQLLRDLGVFDLVDQYQVTDKDYEEYNQALEQARRVQAERMGLKLGVKRLAYQISEIVQQQKGIREKLRKLGRKAHPRKAKLKVELTELEQQKQALKDEKQALIDEIEQQSMAYSQARFKQCEARAKMDVKVMSELDQRLENIKDQALEYRYQIYTHFRNVICERQSAWSIVNKLIKRVAYELVKVGIQNNESQFVIRYSGNEVFKDQMMQAFQAKWNQKLDKNRVACEIRNLKEEDLITENEGRSKNTVFGHSFDQEIGQREGGVVKIQRETEVKMGCN